MSDELIDDILALIHQREHDLRGELTKLEAVKTTLNGTLPEPAVVPVATATRRRARREMTPAQRKAVSTRMKAVWRARRASKR